jgi:hypothetical protein
MTTYKSKHNQNETVSTTSLLTVAALACPALIRIARACDPWRQTHIVRYRLWTRPDVYASTITRRKHYITGWLSTYRSRLCQCLFAKDYRRRSHHVLGKSPWKEKHAKKTHINSPWIHIEVTHVIKIDIMLNNVTHPTQKANGGPTHATYRQRQHRFHRRQEPGQVSSRQLVALHTYQLLGSPLQL